MTDTEKLRDVISRAGLKYCYIAEQMGLSPYGLQKKIDNKTEFKASEIQALSMLLQLSEVERSAIFFA